MAENLVVTGTNPLMTIRHKGYKYMYTSKPYHYETANEFRIYELYVHIIVKLGLNRINEKHGTKREFSHLRLQELNVNYETTIFRIVS